MTANLTLTLHATEQADAMPSDWSGRCYRLNASRDAASLPTHIDVAADAVLELELADGQRLLVAAEDAPRYLGRAVPGEGGGWTIHVGSSLRPTGPVAPTATRDGVVAWALRALRVYDRGPAGVTALALAGSFQDARLGQRLGLYRLGLEDWQATPVAAMPAAGAPTLLFLHGTASSCEGSFRGLWGGKDSELDARGALRIAYGERVFGFEHRSLTESPVQNALDLVERLPQGARLHLVSHSRGGLVGELLARANRLDAEPVSDAEIAAFVAQAVARAGDDAAGQAAAAAEGERLRRLSRALRQKAIQVERFVRVAAPLRGTTLVAERLDRWATVMLNLLGGALDGVADSPALAAGYAVAKTFLLKLVQERGDARVLPGLEAMRPDSPLVALLNGDELTLAPPVHVIAGDYEGGGLLAWIANWLAESFYDGKTDLVVNTPSMSGGGARQDGLWVKAVAGAEVHHFSYFRRAESARALLAALAGNNDGFERLPLPSRSPTARGGVHTKPRPEGPIALMLPGIMGSHLKAGGEWVWFFIPGIVAGRMEALRMDGPERDQIRPDGWIDLYYERFAQHLAQSHEVRPFAYDWRKSIVDAAERFALELDAAMGEAERRRQPLRIVAHSMGGLVARLALKERWPRFRAIPGSRLVQFGTPNMGSHSIAGVLTGRDAFVQMIEGWDWRHDMNEFLGIASRFPGVLELLPWPSAHGRAGDGNDYFDPAFWSAWWHADAENRGRGRALGGWQPAPGAGDGWPLPDADDLAAARQAVEAIMAAPMDAERTCYVAGKEPTPLAMRENGGRLEIQWVEEGDGRVPWCTGIPPGVPAWRVTAAHGDLLNEDAAFDDYVSLISNGDCGLDRVSPQMQIRPRGAFLPAGRAALALYPSRDELLAAAMGGRRPVPGRRSATQAPVTIEIRHDSLASATAPVLIGAYAHDPLRGSAEFLDRVLGGELAGAKRLGRYPNQPGEAAVFLRADPQATPRGAVVVGLGPVGELKPGVLARALTHGFTEYARWQGSASAVEIACLLVGTGFGGLPVALGVHALLDALSQANRLLQGSGRPPIGKLSIYEDEESRVIAAAKAVLELAGGGRHAGGIRYDGRIVSGAGGYRGLCNGGDAGGWQRVHIVKSAGGGLRFTLVSGRARNEVDDEADQRQAVEGLMKSATTSSSDQPGLSRALFELMVPNGLKEALPDMRGAILAVDETAAVFPWELMRDEAATTEPLATRIGLIRQLAATEGRRQVATVAGRRVLVVGDTDSGAPLPGAEREGRTVAGLFRDADYDVLPLYKASGERVFVELFDGGYRCLHLAAHGSVEEEDAQGRRRGHTGVVLGKDSYLTAAQVAKMRQVPEVVFLNCCHLGNMAADAQPRWGKLAAGLATQFIELGCKAVVAAGWAVDDDTAEVFAVTFWRAMLGGTAFGEAVRQARAAAYAHNRNSNTWGAYQAYGDERFRMKADDEQPWCAPDYLHAGQAIADLDLLKARLATAAPSQRDEHRRWLAATEDALRARFFGHGGVRERLGDIHKILGNRPAAIEHYRAAIALEDGSSSLHGLEQLANLEVRQGEDLIKQAVAADASDAGAARETAAAQIAAGQDYLKAGTERIDALVRLSPTGERLALKASAWKRSASAGQLLDKPSEEWLDAVQEMTTAYERAIAATRPSDADPDYYPLLNAIDGAAVLAAHGRTAALAKLEKDWPDWPAAARRNAARRLAQQAGFFHAAADIDAQRTQALRACLGGTDTAAPLTDATERERLLGLYRDLFRRQGDANERDSVLSHVDWLVRLWPEGKDRAGLTSLRNELRHLI